MRNDLARGSLKVTGLIAFAAQCAVALAAVSGFGVDNRVVNSPVEEERRTFGVTGRVTSSNGMGIVGATMVFTRVSGMGTIPPPVQTDRDGRWTQRGFYTESTYKVTPNKQSGVFNPASVEISGARADVNFLVHFLVAASGKVTTARAVGIRGVTLTFEKITGAGHVPPPVESNEMGDWIQTGFDAEATYMVTPAKPGFTFAPASKSIIGPSFGVDFQGAPARSLRQHSLKTTS